jgi:hypothetical protein
MFSGRGRFRVYVIYGECLCIVDRVFQVMWGECG